MHFICHATSQDHFIEMSCMFVSESSSQLVTTLKSLVTKGILIVRGKMLLQNYKPYEYVMALKN